MLLNPIIKILTQKYFLFKQCEKNPVRVFFTCKPFQKYRNHFSFPVNRLELFSDHVDFENKIYNILGPKRPLINRRIKKNFNYLCFLDMCNLTLFSFFINSPHMLQATGTGSLLNAFFTANLASSKTSTGARAISL
ncbi:hypothetical protein BpHYR1_008257 [Brachionus plicatilis]|uniref:Uncharacterized protein n=1 Tax=Brachionus plicatilis TaxID=10195 RepID=A0A3M7S6W3_BRAPC|nr:hypothetical protein BpHYR1_008257 [Brachionus plicatilis]